MRRGLFALCVLSAALALPLATVNSRNLYRFNSSQACSHLIENSTNVDVWSERYRIGAQVDVLAEDSFGDALSALGVNFEILMHDVDSIVESQKIAREAVQASGNADYSETYHSYEEIVEQMKKLANTYEGTEFIEDIGKSLEGRAVPALRFGMKKPTANPFGPTPFPSFWIQCNIHAREWISGATCMYMIENLLKGKDTEYKDIFSSIQILWAPMVNPDGFVYSMGKNRMWRKNRRQNSDGSFGVDLNRNWADHFGGEGSSNTPSSDIYHGPNAFSEPETNNIMMFLLSEAANGAYFQAAVDVHAYSQLVLRPYGWTLPKKATPPNDTAVKKIGDKMREAIKAVHGTSFTSEHSAELYVACGGADDWFASGLATQNFAFTLELRDTGKYGFVLPDNQIIPSGEEMLPAIAGMFRDVIAAITSETCPGCKL